MAAELGSNRYGKSGIRLVTVDRHGDRHDLTDLTVDVWLDGDFLAAHRDGDNAAVLPTDTMRATVYAFARQHPVTPVERFGLRLAERFLEAAPAAEHASVTLSEQPWQRLGTPARPHPHAFVGAAGARRTATVRHGRHDVEVCAGVAGAQLLKTSGSAFAGFVRDRYTVLAETHDRILATMLTAWWRYATSEVDYDAAYAEVCALLTATFADHDSASVQHTLYAMGQAVIDACPDVNEVGMSMPNQHHVLADLTPFGLDNPNAVFVAVDRPYGMIEGTVRRATP